MALTVLKTFKQSPSIKNMIHERLAGWENPRADDWLHASELMKKEFCPREWYFRLKGISKGKREYIGTSLRLTFDHGRWLEGEIRNNWLRDVAVGQWKCGACLLPYKNYFGKAPLINCPSCGTSAARWVYSEPRFHSDLSGIGGSLDIIVDCGEPKLRVVELKSIDKDYFKNLLAPMAEHKFRTSLYLRLIEESGQDVASRINLHTAHILYVSKSFGFKDTSLKAAGISDAGFSPFKEYVVTRDDSLTDPYVAKAIALNAAKLGHGVPCGICLSGFSPRAQQCSSVGPCFSGHYPQTITWHENGKLRHPGKEYVEQE